MRWITRNGNRIPIFNKTLKLSPKRYEYLTSQIEEHGSKEQKRNDILNYKYIGDYVYYYIRRDFKVCEFYGRLKIEGNEALIDSVKKYIVELNQNAFF